MEKTRFALGSKGQHFKAVLYLSHKNYLAEDIKNDISKYIYVECRGGSRRGDLGDKSLCFRESKVFPLIDFLSFIFQKSHRRLY